jgi:hypothetical protein
VFESGKVAIRTVANLTVPEFARSFPRFLFHLGKTRDGRNAWGTWTGAEDAAGQFLSPLGEELKALPLATIREDPEYLVERLERNWKPSDELPNWGEV